MKSGGVRVDLLRALDVFVVGAVRLQVDVIGRSALDDIVAGLAFSLTSKSDWMRTCM